MAKNNESSKNKGFKKRLASVLACTLVGVGTAGLLAGCSGDVTDILKTGSDAPETGVVGQLFLDTDDSKLYKYTEEGWEFVVDLKGDKGATGSTGATGPQGPEGSTGVGVQIREVDGVFEWKYTIENEDGWETLFDTTQITDGDDGKNVELQVNDDEKTIEWRVEGGSWAKLMDLSLITGKDGEDGAAGAAGKDGVDGKEVELQVNDDEKTIEWRLGDGEWATLIALSELKGDDGAAGAAGKDGVDGKEVELQVNDDDKTIEWRLGDGEWETLIALSELKGADGAAGKDGVDGEDAPTITSVRMETDKWNIATKMILSMSDETTVESEAYVVVHENLEYTATSADEVKTLVGYGAGNIKLGANIALDAADLDISKLKEFNVNLNGYDWVSEAGRFVVDSEKKVSFENGVLDMTVVAGNYAAIEVKTLGGLRLDEVELLTNGTGVYVHGTAAYAKVTDSTIVGGTYAIGTNAAAVENHDVIIEVLDSKLIARGYTTDANEAWYDEAYLFDGAGLLVNVPAEVYVEDSEIVGPRQGAILRVGTIKLKDTKVVNTCKYANDDPYRIDDQFTDESALWGTGTDVAMGALVLGDHSENPGYNYAANITLDNVTSEVYRYNVPELVIASNMGETKTSLVLENHKFTATQLASAKFAYGASFTLRLSEIDPALDLYDMYGDSAFSVVQVELARDVVVYEQSMSMDKYAFIEMLSYMTQESEYSIYPMVRYLEVSNAFEFEQASSYAMYGFVEGVTLVADITMEVPDLDQANTMFDQLNINTNGHSINFVKVADVTTREELQAAMADATVEKVYLRNNIDLPTAIQVTRSVSLDLNGFAITVREDTVGDGVFWVKENGNLTIYDETGNGVIDGSGKNDYNIAIMVDEGGILSIYGGKYTNENLTVNPDDPDSDHYDLIYSRGGHIYIYGGSFVNATPEWTLNIKNEYREIGEIVVYGGKFYNFFDPSLDTWDDQIVFIADGYMAYQIDEMGTFEVRKAEPTPIYVGSWLEFAEVIDGDDFNPTMNYISLTNNLEIPVYDPEEIEFYQQSFAMLEEMDVIRYNDFSVSYVMTARVYSVEDFQAAMAEPTIEQVELAANIDLPTAIQVTRKVKLDLYGYALTVREDTVGDGVFWVREGGDLTIVDTIGGGIVNGAGNNIYNIGIMVDEGGVLSIYGGHYTNTDLVPDESDTDSDHYDLIYSRGGEIYIYGGSFVNATPVWTLNIKNEFRGIGVIEVYGGTFYSYFDPSRDDYDDQIVFLAEGYESVDMGEGMFEVREIEESSK